MQIIDALLHAVVDWCRLLAVAHGTCEGIDLLLQIVEPSRNIIELVLVVAVLLDSTFEVIVRILQAIHHVLQIAQGFLGGSANVIIP